MGIQGEGAMTNYLYSRWSTYILIVCISQGDVEAGNSYLPIPQISTVETAVES